MYAVFRDSNSHCCLRVNDAHDVVEFIALVEESGEIRVDLFKMEGRAFYAKYHELTEYPVKRAAQHYLNPLTPAIVVSKRVEQHLNRILGMKKMSEENLKAEQQSTEQKEDTAKKKRGKAKKASEAIVQDNSAKAERNIEQTGKAGLRTNGKVTAAPKPAPVKVVGDVKAATTKAKKGTWDKKESPTEANRDAQKTAVRKHKEEQQKAAKKAARKAAKAATKSNTTNDTNEEKSMSTTKKTATKKTAAKKATKVAKKTVKGTGKGSSAAAKKQTAAASKTAKKQTGGAKRGRAGKYDEGMKITVLVKENPKREGSAAYDIFELLKKSKTVGDFYAKGGAAHNLRWNEDREYIKVG